jgi:hypothetical protein
MGHKTKRIENVDIETCKRACLAEKSFYCRSFDYTPRIKWCDLKIKSNKDSGIRIMKVPELIHFERNVTNSTKPCGWKKFANSDLGGNDVIRGKTWKTDTPQECQAKCDADTRCKSIMWATD